jgi:uncharacterized membrane protein (TIGR02234 family)
VKRYGPFALALLLDLLGGGGALLVSTRHWQTVTTPRPAPLHDDVLRLSGRTVDAAPTALALVALAGVVAVLATRGVARRVVGAVLAAAGVGLIWRAVASASAVSVRHARTLVSERHPTVDVARAVPHVETHTAWPVLTLVCGVLVAAAGGLGCLWREPPAARLGAVALVGAPVAGENDPERAVRAALAIRDWAVEANNLQVRIGVNTGVALVDLDAGARREEGMAVGDVVNTAARLQAAAPIGGILVGESTRRATEAAVAYADADAAPPVDRLAARDADEPIAA